MDGGAVEAGGFAAEEFGEVGVFLLRHGGGAGRKGFGEVEEVELGSRVEGQLFGEAGDVQAESAEQAWAKSRMKVAVGGGVDGVGGGGGEAEGL